MLQHYQYCATEKASYLEAPEDFGIDVSTRLAEMRAEEKAPAKGGR